MSLLHLVFLHEMYGWIISVRYAGWPCLQILNGIKSILNCTIYLTGSNKFWGGGGDMGKL